MPVRRVSAAVAGAVTLVSPCSCLCEHNDMATALYQDRWITCEPDRLVIRGYYFPLGTSKVIPYRDIKGINSVPLGAFTGRWRIWGSSDLRHWYHLDWSRPGKQTALVLDLGSGVQPVITPDDPARVADVIEERRGSTNEG